MDKTESQQQNPQRGLESVVKAADSKNNLSTELINQVTERVYQMLLADLRKERQRSGIR